MSEYKPDDKVLKQIVDDMPEQLKTQIKLDKIAVVNASDFQMKIDRINGETHVDVVGPPNKIMAGGAMLNAAVATVGAAHSMLDVSVDELLIFIRETLKLSNVQTKEK